LQELSSPSLTVAKADGIIQVTPPALRFWEKLGLHPRAGSKDLTVFAFFEGNDDETEAQVADWLDRFSAVYMVRHHFLF
jgi:mediator of RNA polymerase II transcription subunit 13, fungi type